MEAEVYQREEKKTYNDSEGKYSKLFKLKVSDIVGQLPSNKRQGHPLHDSDTDSNFSLSKDGTICHCWRHLVSLNAVQYLCVKAGYMNCEDAGTPHKARGISKIRGDKEAYKVAYNEAVKMKLIEEYKTSRKGNILLDRISQVKMFHEQTPFFYDKNKIWWLWNYTKFKYEKSDDEQILGLSYDIEGNDIVSSKERTEITNALKHVGRKNIPEEPKDSWIQFKETIIDIATGEHFEATPQYFMTNPVNHNLGGTEDTPYLDKLFSDWVGEENIIELYEILAFAQAPKYFIHRILCLIGSGANGKSTYLKILEKFIGEDNLTSSSLYLLLKQRFEGSKLYKKLVCLMGETSFDLITNTDYLKKLSGEDMVRAEFKGKNGFISVFISVELRLIE